MSNIQQARELVEEVLISYVVDEDARKLLRKALRLLRPTTRKRQETAK